MEASAMFAVAKAFDVKAAAIFVVSDNLTGKMWKQEYNSTPEKIISIFKALLKNAGKKINVF